MPHAALLGAEGEGFKLAMRTLDIFRASVAAAATGFARRALDAGIAHARSRRMFGATLADLQLTQARVGDMAAAIDAAALLTFRAAWLRDVRSARTTKEAAMAKLAATESAQQVIDAAVQLHGGLGVTRGHIVERLYRDIRALRIYEGATEVQKTDHRPGTAEGGHRHERYTAHIDTFARDHLPPRDQWPDLVFDLPELRYPGAPQLRGGTPRSRRLTAAGASARPSSTPAGLRWTYAELMAHANRIARVLVEDMRLVPGNRVLLRGPNSPMMAACWFAVMKAGGVAVATMPLLRAKELTDIITKAQISHALCDARLAAELDAARAACPTLGAVVHFETDAPDGLEARAAAKPADFANVATAAEDTALIAFTSGTTGRPKGTMHFHRDVMASCDCWPRSMLRATADDIFTGSPPLAFTFGLGGLLLFPLRAGAATLLLEKPSPDALLRGDRREPRDGPVHGADVLPRDGGAGGAIRPREPAQVRIGGRGASRRDAEAVEGRHRHRD